ncbi:MAG: hypothetical protein ABIQ80_06145 [Fibrobacteria bacterium]
MTTFSLAGAPQPDNKHAKISHVPSRSMSRPIEVIPIRFYRVGVEVA